MQEQPIIFSLDIGTRSVVGLIIKKVNDLYEVIDIESIEHSERSMVDGQIHDVRSVSNVITQVKHKLEQKHGPLHKVCVAAAGRALKTERAKVTLDIKRKPLIQKEDILHMELSAVQQAQFALASKYTDENNHYYYCVGYSIMHYHLDGEEIGNLMDQQGEEASVEIIATFLPKIVVESLLSALQQSGLEMEALTLEPIAAINVLIPPSMRRLNVALVDIGAGTSDIAITDEGTVVAYGMVPIAGDEITEAISDELLLDFPLAEKAKRDLYTHENILIEDILGFETEISRLDVINKITDTIDLLANSICQEILRLNRKSPKAIMLVGGGSLTPELPKRIANMLELPENRVAIRGIDAIKNIKLADHLLRGPELVTPIGIAIASGQSPVQYLTVYVNDRPVRLFDMKQLTVGDCLLAAGINMNKLYGKPGMAIMITLNNREYTIPGNHGLAPTLLINGTPCMLDSLVRNGDQLLVEKGEDGKAASITVSELVDEPPTKSIVLNERLEKIRATIMRNGKPIHATDFVKDHDNLTYHFPETIEEILNSINASNLTQLLKPFSVSVNSRKVSLHSHSGKIVKNKREVPKESGFIDQDIVEIVAGPPLLVKELAEHLQLILTDSTTVFFRGEKITLTRESVKILKDGAVLKETDIIENGDSIQTVTTKTSPFIFQDIFRFIDLELPTIGIKGFKLLRNEKEVGFDETLVPGDQLDIVF
ncbi:cell division protein FtsA [Bacillus mesophilus]|uniref:Cell division protein n=1 Tax=Bacillus mesophilus TaxID=1808955 RepID=A0A6M0Q6H3_9BACI|nr:cell division FtsA domain-containing protein [Bacillus mesophilus]MBM7660508.1 cell division protein FtsA [Bacillus mesophilus]NEY71942.1 cell division protein [Bacillus mesophilus]